MPNLSPIEIALIVLLILVLFGYKKLPDAARAIGRSARIFKAETKGLRDEPAPRDLEAKAEAEYLRQPGATPPPAATPVTPPNATTAPPPTPPVTPPAAEPAPTPAPAPPQSETR